MEPRVPAEAFPVTEFIKEELEARSWNQADLANIIGRSPKDVSTMLSGKVPLKPDMATLLGDAFGTGPEYWMNLETAYRAWLTSRETREAVARRASLFEVAPVREMQKRRWIKSTDDVEQLEHYVLRFYGVPSIDDVRRLPVPMAARMSGAYAEFNGSANAWARRAKNLAPAVSAKKPFSDASLADCLARLRLLLTDAEEARRVPRILADYGIRFMVVQHLPQTRLDGACLWLDATQPIVVMSMRYERLDYFWFTLFHELGHVKERDGLSSGGVVDSGLVGEGAIPRDEKPEYEQKADAFAEDALVPRAEMENFIARVRPLYSKERIRLFAKRLDVHPALVIGQLQFRKEVEYSHSRDFLKDRLRQMITSNALTDGWGHEPITA